MFMLYSRNASSPEDFQQYLESFQMKIFSEKMSNNSVFVMFRFFDFHYFYSEEQSIFPYELTKVTNEFSKQFCNCEYLIRNPGPVPS